MKKLKPAKIVIISTSAGQTIKLGKTLGRLSGPGQVIALIGQLGTGKTTLTKGLSLGLGIHKASVVTSPSFVLIREYQGRLPVYHFDLYRLNKLEEVEQLGYEEYFYAEGVTIIEWADKIKPILPDEYLAIELSFVDEEKEKKNKEKRRRNKNKNFSTNRKIILMAHGQKYRRIIAQL